MKLFSGILVCGFILSTIAFSGAITQKDPLQQDISQRLKPPFWIVGSVPGHILGTDNLGRDIAARLVYGARISWAIASIAVIFAGGIGTILGVLSGYFSGTMDLVIGAITDFMLAFPFILTALLVAAVMRPAVINLVIVLAISNWPTYTRIARTETASVREREFVLAATAIGRNSQGILRYHILPNISNSMIVIASLEVARLMVSEAFLSFLGVGVPDPLPAWGSMIAQGRDYLLQQWWLATLPGVAIFLSVIGMNLIGDGLRDLLDPRSRL
jgi:peptide/nickel transport system permease protein